MSLSVHVYRVDAGGRKQFIRSIDWKAVMAEWRTRGLSPEESRREAQRLFRQNESWQKGAGPEAWRTELYGSAYARSLGLTLLPSLALGNLDVAEADLTWLGDEVAALVQNVAPLAREVGQDSEGILPALRNIAGAVAEAKSIGGGVIIW